MCNLRTDHWCGHVSYRKVTCVAKKTRRQKYCFPLFASVPKCVNTNPQVSFDFCPSCLRRDQSDRHLQSDRAAQQDIALQPMQPLPGQVRPTSVELMIEAAMLPGHFDVSRDRDLRDLTINSHVQAALTMVPGMDYAPQVRQRYPPHLTSATTRSRTTRMAGTRSGAARPRGAPLPSSPGQHRRTNTSHWVDTTRFPRGDDVVSPVLPGWTDPAMVSPISSVADMRTHREQAVVRGDLGFF